MINKSTRAAASGKTEAAYAAAQADRLLPFIEVNRLIGSRCRTGHTARALMRKGLIRGTRINERVIRYSENSVLALIAGRTVEAQPEPTSKQLIDRDVAKLCAELPSQPDLDLDLELSAISLRTDVNEDQKKHLAHEARRAHATRKESA